MTSCYPDNVLRQMLADPGSVAHHKTVEDHVETCPHCQQALARLSGDNPQDSWQRRLRTELLPKEDDSPGSFLFRLKTNNPLLGKGLAAGAEEEGEVELIEFPRPATAEGPLGQLASYHIMRELGRGNFGIVFQAFDGKLKRLVAIKVLKPQLAANAQECARFTEEAQAAAGIQDDHVVTVYEVNRTADFLPPYLVMEYIDGESLGSRLQRQKMLPPHDAALVCRQAALGLAAAHRGKLVHRDVKPSNILLESRTGRAKITDFGLARSLEVTDEHSTSSGWIAGTPAYISPEQIDSGKASTGLSDVYSLGVVLYELLTGERPFRGVTPYMVLQQVLHDEPPAPRKLNNAIPRDLETICVKCLQKEPGKRYATADALAQDLNRFLAREPIQARPVGNLERLWRWCRRRPAVAGLTAALGLAFFFGFPGGTWLWSEARLQRERANELHIQGEIRQMEFDRRPTKRSIGWRKRHWERGRDAVATHKSDELKHELANGCIGLDLALIKRFDAEAGGVTFDQSGSRILLGAVERQGNRGQPAKLWDSQSRELLASTRAEAGPVAFRADKSPVQLVHAKDTNSLLLWDMVKQQAVQTLSFPMNEQPDRVVEPTMSPDASHVAALVSSKDQSVLIVWETATGKVLHRLEETGRVVTFSGDKSLLAAGDENGRLAVWGLLKGERIATIQCGRMAIQRLAFSPDAGLLQTKAAGNRTTGRVAVGNSGGMVFTYDLATLTLSVPFRGSPFHIYALAFSPDGTILASGGRSPINLWDSATGRLLLEIPQDYTRGLAFSPDGTQLAASSETVYGPGETSIWKLQNGVGIQTLLGLSNRVAKVAFSPNGRYLAALSHNWEVAIWDSKTSQLRHLLEAPKGEWVDNADLRFSPDESHLAFAGYREAKLWEVASGRELDTWPLRPGLVNALAFHSSGKLLLFRVETKDGKLPPTSIAPPDQHPRVCRIHELWPQRAKPVEILLFNRHVFYSLASPDATYFVAGGRGWS